MEVLGLVKKFHILTGESSERELRESRELADVADGFDKETACP